MAKSKITLYVDIVSPFGYMAYYMLRVSAAYLHENLSSVTWADHPPQSFLHHSKRYFRTCVRYGDSVQCCYTICAQMIGLPLFRTCSGQDHAISRIQTYQPFFNPSHVLCLEGWG